MTKKQPEISIREAVINAYGMPTGVLYSHGWAPPNAYFDVKCNSKEQKAVIFFPFPYYFGFDKNIAEAVIIVKSRSLELQKYSRYLEFLDARGYKGLSIGKDKFSLQSQVTSQSDLDRIVGDIKDMLEITSATKPKILEQVEQRSRMILQDIALGNHIEMGRCKDTSVIFWPDYRVRPDVSPRNECTCFYGGDSVCCSKNDTSLLSTEKREKCSRFDNCVVRQYTKMFLEGKEKLEGGQK